MKLTDSMLGIDPFFETRPMINKTISGIYRDMRFSQNKLPYKISFWITFKRPRKDWKDAPAYFFEIYPETYRYGMGFYGATPQTMQRFRAMIAENRFDFEQAIAFYAKQKTFVLKGEKYKKTLNCSLSKSVQKWYQRKNFYLVCSRKTDNVLFSSELFNKLKVGFETVSDLYRFLLQM